MLSSTSISLFFFFNDPAPTEIYTLSLHDALPIWRRRARDAARSRAFVIKKVWVSRYDETRSEEHTSELQSQSNLVCRLLLEKKNNTLLATVIAFIMVDLSAARSSDEYFRVRLIDL